MTYRETKGDLFTAPSESLLAHCISADFALGAGIAKVFAEKYNVRKLLNLSSAKGEWNGTGYCALVSSSCKGKEMWKVANLVTKEKCWQKPTYQTLRDSLLALSDICKSQGFQELAMPLIGCGLDGLEWSRVSAMIQEVFKNSSVNITVYRL